MSSPSSRLSMNRLAFTLLELLVAIVIVVALLAMLGLALPGWRSRAQSVQCMQNLRNAGSALCLYAGDNNGKKAGMIYSFLGGSVPGEDTWSNRLLEGGYLNHRAVLRCPAVKPSIAITAADWYRETYGLNMVTQSGISIGENISRGGYSGGVFYLPLARVTEPSRLILLSDSRGAALSPTGNEVQRFRLLKDGNAKTDAMSLRHGGKVNVCFLDGHVQALGQEELRSLQGKPYAVVPYYLEDGTFCTQ